jgi:hypothetical protein
VADGRQIGKGSTTEEFRTKIDFSSDISENRHALFWEPKGSSLFHSRALGFSLQNTVVFFMKCTHAFGNFPKICLVANVQSNEPNPGAEMNFRKLRLAEVTGRPMAGNTAEERGMESDPRRNLLESQE